MPFDFTSTINPDILEALKELRPKLKLCGPLKILFVVDGGIDYGSGFGIGRVRDIINDTTRGWVDFQVDARVRSTTIFNDALLNQYHQVWLFGINGGNGSLSPAEQTAFQTWMDTRQGGVFATGDHDDLGAALARQIPRAGTMRRWTTAQQVPPGATEGRIDTNRPEDASQGPPQFDMIPGSAQGDAVPQPIEWVTWMRNGGILGWRAPHPILCHPRHGPIDVMPDHPHEGMCFDTATANFEVDVSNTVEYPSVGSVRPLPKVIAYGHTLADPPYHQAKRSTHPGTPMPAKRFPMISVYDGQQIGIGRVVVDSTWHHWMGMNINGIEAAATATGASAHAIANWEKIRTYFVNIAVWLATAHQRRCMNRWFLTAAHFSYVGFEELRPKASIYELGLAMSLHLKRWWGPCWVRDWIFDELAAIDIKLQRALRERFVLDTVPPRRQPPVPDPVCLSCPPWEALEIYVLGGIAQASIKQHAPIVERFMNKRELKLDLSDEADVKAIESGVRAGLASFEQALQGDLKSMKPMLASLKAAASG
jgi:hypothetical protein